MAEIASLAEILESEQFISQFFERSHVGLAVLDKDFRYRMLNPYLAASHNSPAECHLGKHIREILGDVAPQVEAAMKNGGTGYVLKSDAGNDLLPAIKEVLEGKRFISASLAGL